MRKLWLYALVVCLSACSKEDKAKYEMQNLPGPNGFRGWHFILKRQYLNGNGDITYLKDSSTCLFYFNADMSVSHIDESGKVEGRQIKTTHMFYYRNGRLAIVKSFNPELNYRRECLFQYEGERLVRASNGIGMAHTFSYDGEGRLIQRNTIYNPRTMEVTGYESYSWSGEKIAQTRKFDKESGTMKETYRQNFVFDGNRYEAIPVKSMAEKWYIGEVLEWYSKALLGKETPREVTGFANGNSYKSNNTQYYNNFYRDSAYQLRLRSSASVYKEWYDENRPNPYTRDDGSWEFLYHD